MQYGVQVMRTLMKWSVADYQQMRNLGILDRHRCELIKGEILEMAPEGEFLRYAESGIQEYWVIDVEGRQVTVFRDLEAGDF